jgi:hypothetical protein
VRTTKRENEETAEEIARAREAGCVSPGLLHADALDSYSPVRPAALRLEQAGTAGLPAGEPAAGYYHSVPSDLSRARAHHGLTSATDAVRFLMAEAPRALGDQVARDAEGRYRLVVPFEELRYTTMDGPAPLARPRVPRRKALRPNGLGYCCDAAHGETTDATGVLWCTDPACGGRGAEEGAQGWAWAA